MFEAELIEEIKNKIEQKSMFSEVVIYYDGAYHQFVMFDGYQIVTKNMRFDLTCQKTIKDISVYIISDMEKVF